MTEVWKTIPGFPDYEVSDLGRVRLLVSRNNAAHQDGNPANNALANLKWETRKENQGDRVRHGTDNRGERHPMRRLTRDDVAAIRGEPRTLGSGRALSKRFGVTPAAISAIRNGKLWRHV